MLVTKALSQGVRTNCFRKEQAVTDLPRSARGCQAEEVRSGCGSEQMGLPDPDSSFGTHDSGGGGIWWGHPLARSKHILPPNIPVTLGESASPCTAHPHPYATGSPSGKLAAWLKKLSFNWVFLDIKGLRQVISSISALRKTAWVAS